MPRHLPAAVSGSAGSMAECPKEVEDALSSENGSLDWIMEMQIMQAFLGMSRAACA